MGKEIRHDKELARYSSDLQSQENQRQEKWNADEWSRQFQAQSDEWQRQFQAQVNEQMRQEKSTADEWTRQQEYQSPENQAARLRAVGVNPAIALAGGSTASGISVSSPSVSVPGSPGSISIPGRSSVSPGFGNPDTFPVILNALNEATKNLSHSSLEKSQKDQIDTMLSGQIRQQILSIENQGLQNAMQRMANDVYKAGMPAYIQKAGADLANVFADTFLKVMQGKNMDEDSALKRVQAAFTKFQHMYAEERKPYELATLKFDYEHLETKFREFMKTEAANRAALYGQANQANTQADLNKSIKAITDTKNEREKIQKYGDLLSNLSKRYEIDYQRLGLSKAQFESIINGNALEALKDSKSIENLSGALHILETNLPAIIKLK